MRQDRNINIVSLFIKITQGCPHKEVREYLDPFRNISRQNANHNMYKTKNKCRNQMSKFRVYLIYPPNTIPLNIISSNNGAKTTVVSDIKNGCAATIV